jgi:hypothetical protein
MGRFWPCGPVHCPKKGLTMSSPADPAAFVVSTEDRKAARLLSRRLGAIGRVEPLCGQPGRFVVTPTGDPIGAADRIAEVARTVAADVRVEPVLTDDRGHPIVQTGKVIVRFKTDLTDAQVTRFARPLGLTVDGRNKYVRSQVAFRVAAGASAKINEIVDRVRAHDAVERVWPETLGYYQRA